MQQSSPILRSALPLILFGFTFVVEANFGIAQPPSNPPPPQAFGPSAPPQSENSGDEVSVPGTSEAGEPDDADAVQASEITVAILPSGRQRQVPGFWTSLSVSGTNRTDEDTEELVIAMVGDDTNSQFARRFWIPANARRSGWLLAEVPEDIDSEQSSIPLRTIHLMETERGEEFRTNYLGMPTSQRQMLISRENMRTGVMLTPDKITADRPDLVDRLGDFIYAGRDQADVSSQDLGVVHLDVGFLPTTPRALDPFDQLVIAGDSVLSDTTAVEQIRTWLVSGGRLWVMVDRIEPDSLRRLMGETLPFSVVDRVELNAYDHVERPVFAGTNPIVEPWSSEIAAELVRVFADVEDVQSEIDGWPTAFWVPVGEGEVLFTTLSPNGWTRDEQATQIYTSVAQRFFVERISETTQATELKSYLGQQIGYSIPSRSSVAGILGVYMLLVLGAGLVLAQRRALHLLAAVVPVAALVATGWLVVLGKQRTAAVPSTIAVGQIGRAAGDSGLVQVNSVAAVYSQESRDLDIQSGYESATKLEETSTGDVRRVVWDDAGQSTWMFVKQPPGVVRHVASQSSLQMSQPWRVQGRFTEQGFEGRLDGLDLSTCEDPVLATKALPSMSADLDLNNGDLRLTTTNVLTPGQYIDSALMSDVQQDRQTLMRQLLGPDSTVIDNAPSLLVWSDPVDVGLKFDDDFERRGTLLASIPITLLRQPEGEPFVVPPGFVRLEPARSASGFSSVYNERTGEWQGRDSAADAQVRCVIPDSVLPCKLDRLLLRIKMNAPMRTFEIKAYANDEWVSLFTQSDPNGVLNIEITDSDKLQVDPDGGLLLAFSLSATEEELKIERGEIDDEGIVISQDEWQIDYVHVTVGGRTEFSDPSE